MSRLLFAATVAVLAMAPAAAYTLPVKSQSAAGIANPIAGILPAALEKSDDPMPFVLGNLVVNGSFETADFTGWAQVNDTSFTFVTDEIVGGGPTDGSWHAAFGPTDPGGGGIIQSIATSAGGSYTLIFDLANLGAAPNAFGLFWDGGFVSIDFDVPAFDYGTFSTVLSATGAATDLGFIFYHEPSFWLLDNISLVSADGVVPEPATWGMMIAGFGLVGSALRRRRAAIA